MLTQPLIALVCIVGAATQLEGPATVVEAAPSDQGAVGADALEWDTLYTVSAERWDPLVLDAAGRRWGQDALAWHALRFAPSYAPHKDVRLIGDLQLASANLYADDPNPAFVGYGNPRGCSDDVDGCTDARDAKAFGAWSDELALRKLFVQWRAPMFLLRVGRMSSRWGFGILANSGDETPEWGGTRFGGDRGFGDIVNRLLIATRPLQAFVDAAWAKRLTVATGVDIVERDDRVVRADGDIARQWVGAIRYVDGKNQAGLYSAYRDLDDDHGETLNVWATDFFAKGSVRLGEVKLHAGFEGVLVTGETTLGSTASFPEPVRIDQLGWVSRLGIEMVPWRLGADVEAGYASGDSNPTDGFARGFSFDPQYKPSLILFDVLLAQQSAAAAAQAGDSALVGRPSAGVPTLASKGAVLNAIYLRPTVRYAWRDLSVRTAVLFARAEEDVVDPFGTNVAGGVAQNFRGGKSSERGLGIEWDVGVDYTVRTGELLEVVVSAQGGLLVPGAAFDDADGNAHDNIYAAFARVAMHWLPSHPLPHRTHIQPIPIR